MAAYVSKKKPATKKRPAAKAKEPKRRRVKPKTLARKRPKRAQARSKPKALNKRPGAKAGLKKTVKKKASPKRTTARKKPVRKSPVRKSPVRKKPERKKPTARKPVARKPAARKPTARKPAARKPAARKPAARKPAVRKPAVRKPADRKPAVRKPAPRKPAARKPAPRKPVARKPASRKKHAKKTALRAGKRKKLQTTLATLQKSLDRERYKLRTKKWTSTKKKRLALGDKIARLEARIQKLVAPEPKAATPKQKKIEQADRLEHYREVFDTLLDIAKKEHKLPKIDHRRRRIDSDDRYGDKRVVHANVMVNEEGVEEAIYLIEQAAKKLPGNQRFWICNFSLIAMGENVVGYGNTTLKANHPDAHAFQTAFDSTGVYTRRDSMLVKARSILEDYADERYTLVYLLGFTVMNFSFKERS